MRFFVSVFLFVCFSFLLALSIQDAYGIMKIDKKKVINSPNVCGDKICGNPNATKIKIIITPDYDKRTNLSLRWEQRMAGGNPYVWFEGSGWLGFHNVEIRITGENFATTIISKTNHRGHLSVPWQIPQPFVSQMYDVHATDEVNNVKTKLIFDLKGSKETISKADKCTMTSVPIDWAGCNLYGRVLKEVDLRYANLRKANLFGATLSGKDLTGADLSYASLKRADLDGARIIAADLSYANLAAAKIRNADLSFSKIRHANLVDADLTNSNLTNVDFRDSTLSSSILAFTDLRGANLNFTGTWNANLNHCRNHPICEN
jgi:uncharacterized protein YjbI with pentapeptide repeats